MAIDTREMKTAANGRSKRSGKGASFSVPPQLATPTDLPKEAVQAVSEAVNPIIADALALYMKVKNYHWHLAGSHFRSYHLMLDEHAAELLASIDPLAERIRKIGGTTLRSVSHVCDTQTIADDNDDFVPADEMIQRLLQDNIQMAKAQREAVELCEEQRDHPTSDLLQETLDLTERRIWFLYEIAQGGENQQ